jgi:hypothetical protein
MIRSVSSAGVRRYQNDAHPIAPTTTRRTPGACVRAAATLTSLLGLATLLAASTAAYAGTTENVVLVTLDGVRIQEFFSGMDERIAADAEASGIDEIETVRKRYWRDSPAARREALMPYFWHTLAPMGVVLGNKSKGSSVQVRNDQWFSYPGYSEILTGQPQPDVRSNDIVRYSHRTVLQYLKQKLELAGRADRVVGRIQDGGVERRRRLLHERRLRPRPAAARHARDGRARDAAHAGDGAVGGGQQRRAHDAHRPRVHQVP